MNRLLLTLTVMATSASLLALQPVDAAGDPLRGPPAAAQTAPDARKAKRAGLAREPELEAAMDHLTILRWTIGNPGGSDLHYGVVHYGTDPRDLSQTARSPIKVNRGHPTTTFRVRIEGLAPQTTYYYWVTSEGSNGRNDGVKSAVKRFTTPGPGVRIVR